MKKFIAFLIIPLLLFIVSCGNRANDNGKENADVKQVVFNPQKKQTVVEFSPVTINPIENYSSYQGGARVIVMVPEEFTEINQQHLNNKLIQIASRAGMASFGGDGVIVLYPSFAEIERGLTSTAPQKTMLKYDVTLFVANTYSGEIYASATEQILGVGDTEDLALQSIIGSIDSNSKKFSDMMEVADKAISAYYINNGKQIISNAKQYAATGDYEEAVALLSSIPMSAGDLYIEAQNNIIAVWDKYVSSNADELFAMMQALISEGADEDGYCPEAIAYYVMIPEGTSAKAKADKLFSEYRANISETAQRKTQEAKEQMELEHRRAVEMKQLDVQIEELKLQQSKVEAEAEMAQQESEYRLAVKELEAKVAIEGQTALLKKYEEDAAYDKLPWLRKLVHLGKYDKFDGR